MVPTGNFSRERAPVYRITTAGQDLSADIAGRQWRYLLSMGIRTVCFVGAIVASGWLRWALVAGAVVLPYISVILANAGRARKPAPEGVLLREQPSLPSRREATSSRTAQPGPAARHRP